MAFDQKYLDYKYCEVDEHGNARIYYGHQAYDILSYPSGSFVDAQWSGDAVITTTKEGHKMRWTGKQDYSNIY